jgi:hypothetical protein
MFDRDLPVKIDALSVMLTGMPTATSAWMNPKARAAAPTRCCTLLSTLCRLAVFAADESATPMSIMRMTQCGPVYPMSFSLSSLALLNSEQVA